MPRFSLSLTLAAIAIAIAGCSNRPPLSPDLGESVDRDLAAQIVNPAPLASSQDFDTSGRRMESSIDRYNRNLVYPPVPPISSVAPAGAAPQQPPSGGGGSGSGN
jgi:type IV pilus biogenesis protein CpaD/CtpE